MADVEFGVVSVVGEPDVGFDTGAAVVQGLVERDAPPVVVVAVAFQGDHVAGDVFCFYCRSVLAKVGSFPVLQEVVLLAQVCESGVFACDRIAEIQEATLRMKRQCSLWSGRNVWTYITVTANMGSASMILNVLDRDRPWL